MFLESLMRRISSLGAFTAVLILSLTMQPRALHAQQSEEEEERAKYEPYRDYSEDWRLGSLFGLTPEDGVLLGTGAIVYKFGFREFPYIYRMSLVGGATIPTGRWKFMYTAKFPSLTQSLSLDVLAYASELEVRNFYGFGNSTERIKEKEKDDFYRVASKQYFIEPILKIKLNRATSLGVGASFKHFDIRRKDNRFINTLPLDRLGDRRSLVGAGVMFDFAVGDAAVATRNGFYLGLSAWNHLAPFKKALPFQRYAGDVRGYVSEGFATLALRAYGETVRGFFPFHESAFLGGGANLRGYFLNRFSGDAAVGGSAELRFELFKLKLLVPTTVGIFVFGDAGRVYVDGNSPGGWHADGGGGISLAPISRDLTLSLSIANSPEGIFVNGGFGFAF
jgi:hypothetical protein